MPAENLPLLHLTPEGVLTFSPEGTSAEVPVKLERELRSQAGSPSGAVLLQLANEMADGDLPPDLAFWRHVAREFVMRFCQVPGLRDGAWSQPPPVPDATILAAWIQEAPPVQGMEYLSAEVLGRMWQEMHQGLAARIEQQGSDVEAALRELHPVWRMVGRVTLHLAENKRDPLRPFAFLATYTHRINARSEPQHLPLAKALQESAGRNDRSALQALLAPLTIASKRSHLLQQLITSKRVFQPLAWEPGDAFAFLQDIPVFEESGLLVKVPDWWKGRRPPSPQVQVTLDAGDKKESVGAKALLTFSVNVALGGEPLSQEEIEKILASDAPLISLRGRWIEPDRERLQQALDHWHRAEAAHRDGVPFHEGLRWLAGWGGPGGGGASELTLDDTGGLAAFQAGDSLRELLNGMRAESLGSKQPPKGLKAQLRHYQQTGLDWLDFMGRLGCGACLADDMGLGKTIQLIALVLRRREARLKAKASLQPALVVAPASLLANWQREFG
ncbi:MAG TPA: SNF2 helicase-associated domain-containing protein, partial [Verrucomicrobium sp.]|nr:SNF2 helicase-associated domain-containing protein [Verrucomicrobium sp.]